MKNKDKNFSDMVKEKKEQLLKDLQPLLIKQKNKALNGDLKSMQEYLVMTTLIRDKL